MNPDLSNAQKRLRNTAHSINAVGWRKTDMKYRGFVIEPQYLPGADFKVLRDGTMRDVKPKKEHIDFYWVEDTKDAGFRFTAKTVEEAKERCRHYRATEETFGV